MFQPEYAKGFRCIGSRCEQNCCRAGWGIYIDKATYKKYRATPSLRQAAKEFIQINPAARDSFQFALVKLQSNRCPFLNSENLCAIQQRHGEHFLPKTCLDYPRMLIRVGDHMQKSLFLSCPEAARQVLLSSQLLPVVEQPRYSWVDSLPIENGIEAESNVTFRFLRAMAVDVLQDQTYPLWQRLLLLGNICRRAREVRSGHVWRKLPELCAQYAAIISEGTLRPSLDAIPSRPGPQQELVQRLLQGRFQFGQPEEEFSARVARFLQVMHAESGTLQPDSAERYSNAYAQHGSKFEQASPLFLQNYLLNYIFQTGFPQLHGIGEVSGASDPLVSFLVMILHYRLLHTLLISEAAWYGQAFSPEHAIQMVTTFARAIAHNVPFWEDLRRFAQLEELQTMEGMAMILRN